VLRRDGVLTCYGMYIYSEDWSVLVALSIRAPPSCAK
jgi:hypothetical protein